MAAAQGFPKIESTLGTYADTWAVVLFEYGSIVDIGPDRNTSNGMFECTLTPCLLWVAPGYSGWQSDYGLEVFATSSITQRRAIVRRQSTRY
jgi:hypothetical protein